MSTSTVTKFKWFWADQDLEQETWLRAMAGRGLHLQHVVGVFWTFVQAAPQDVVYRVDYSSHARDSDYNRLLEDAGWECATSSAGWHYWRTAAIDGKAPEIFTDSESKIARFRQVLAILFLLSVPAVLGLPKMADDMPNSAAVLLACLVVLFGYSAIRLLLRINRLAKAGA